MVGGGIHKVGRNEMVGAKESSGKRDPRAVPGRGECGVSQNQRSHARAVAALAAVPLRRTNTIPFRFASYPERTKFASSLSSPSFGRLGMDCASPWRIEAFAAEARGSARSTIESE